MFLKSVLDHTTGFVCSLMVLAVLAFSAPPATAASCESLGSLALPDTTITLAQIVAAGSFTPPISGGSSIAGRPSAADMRFANLPVFCRVTATLKPSSDSEIKVEVWMPVSGWNGNLQSVGNGGWGGIISYPALALALADGYATASTDTGHAGNTGSFALGHPEKFIDFGYRSVHEMTVASKAIIAAYYGQAPKRAYWNGCSTGGRQGLTEAQRYPSDYNGIIAGAPANNSTHLDAWSVSISQAAHKDEASYIPPGKFAVIHKAVMDACDALDGLKDGLIGNPARCRFDPKVLACKNGDGPSCLTPPQVATARKYYAPAKNPRTGQEIYPGLEPGSELDWGHKAGPEPFFFFTDSFKYVTFNNPDWDFRTLNLDRDIALADKIDNGTTSAMDPNLKDFFGRGGKLLMYHGWSDPDIAPRNSINYYQRVLKAMPGTAGDSIRLFMFPGMGHCGGGDGPNIFDAVGALAQWVEKSQPPNQVPASHLTNGVVDRMRPVCPYPKNAAYKGAGSIDDAANFACKAP